VVSFDVGRFLEAMDLIGFCLLICE